MKKRRRRYWMPEGFETTRTNIRDSARSCRFLMQYNAHRSWGQSETDADAEVVKWMARLLFYLSQLG